MYEPLVESKPFRASIRVHKPIQAISMAALFGLLHALSAPGGEVLYNGIELPSQWPPKVDWEDIKA